MKMLKLFTNYTKSIMAKLKTIKTEKRDEPKEPKTEKKVSEKEIPQAVIVLQALDNYFPAWSNGHALEKDLMERIHPVHLRDILDVLVEEKFANFDFGTFSYQITEHGKFYLDSVNK